jgi:hypothetical protein
MKYRNLNALLLVIATILVFGFGNHIHTQGQRGGQRGGPPPTPRAAAKADLTGYWVSVVTEDWQWRMITPRKGDYASIPLNPEGRKVADTWDPAKEQAAGETCKAYGAPAIMRMPGRFRITWENDTTLRIDTDAGSQTRLLLFGASQPPAEPSLQGHSTAEWITAGGTGGYLKVLTRNLRPGYLRKNGVPYSANAMLTEYFDKVPGPNGTEWLIVKTIVEDPQYLTQPFIISTHFKKEPDGSKWSPAPCEVK